MLWTDLSSLELVMLQQLAHERKDKQTIYNPEKRGEVYFTFIQQMLTCEMHDKLKIKRLAQLWRRRWPCWGTAEKNSTAG